MLQLSHTWCHTVVERNGMSGLPGSQLVALSAIQPPLPSGSNHDAAR